MWREATLMDSAARLATDRALAEHRAAGGNTHADEFIVAVGARRLVSEVWGLVERGVIDARSPAADAALDLRDNIDPNWNPSAEVAGPLSDGPAHSDNAHSSAANDVTDDGLRPESTTT